MKKIFLLTLFITVIASALSAQEYYDNRGPEILMNTDQGYYVLGGLVGGIGLGDTKPPFSKFYTGFTATGCYQINKDFIGGIGTGFSVYNKGFLVPLFLHFRWRVYESQYIPYFSGDTGFMIDFKDKNSRAFINPGIGLTYALTPYFGLDFGTGVFVQWGNHRDSYISLNAGVVYKF
jgi:hypothetical protein